MSFYTIFRCTSAVPPPGSKKMENVESLKDASSTANIANMTKLIEILSNRDNWHLGSRIEKRYDTPFTT